MNHVRIRSVALGVIAALAALAVAASSASALPEVGQCFVQPNHEGKYTNSVCTTKAKKVNEKFTGEFEWRKGSAIEAAKRKFEGTGGKVTLVTKYRFCEPNFDVRAQKCPEGETEFVGTPTPVFCTSEVNHGEFSGTKNVVNVAITFKGCELEFFNENSNCQNTATEGEIQLSKLKGKLGFINKGTVPRQVGVLLEPVTKKGKFFTATCNNGLAVAVGEGNETEGCVYPQTACGGDGVISAITPVNTATSEFTQAYTDNATTAEQIPTKFEGSQPLKELESYLFVPATPITSMWSKDAASLTNSDKTPEALEIKAN